MIQGSCQLYAQSILAAVREESYYRSVVNYIPASGNETGRTESTFGALSPTRAMTNPTQWWTGAAPVYDVADVTAVGLNQPALLQNFQLIQGSMRTLASIYNSNPQVQCNFGSYPALTNYLTSKVVASSDLANNPNVTLLSNISIRPFNIQTNATASPCPATVYPMPAGGASTVGTIPASAFNPGWAAAGTGIEAYGGAPTAAQLAIPDKMAATGVGDSTLGLELSVQVNYKDSTGTHNCFAAQKFQYPQDRTPPKPPNIALVTANPTVPLTVCTFNRTTGPTIQIGYNSAAPGASDFEPGTQFLCLDLSWQRGWPANAAPAYAGYPPCIMYNAVGTGSPGIIMDQSVNPGAHDTILPNGYDAPANQVFNRQGQWVPCDLLKQCGQSATTVGYNQVETNTATNNHVLTLTYPQLHPGCVMNFEVVAVDAAGNTSAPAGQTFLGTGPNNEIKYPTCGVLCTPQPSWAPGSFTAGYYTCRTDATCCTGAGCTAFSGPTTPPPPNTFTTSP